jgi:hypothetical protein
MNSKKTLIASAIALSIGMGVNTAHAAQVTVGAPQTASHGNFTSLSSCTAISCDTNKVPSEDGIGVLTGNGFGGGANNLTASWDGTVYTASSDIGSAANMTIANTEAFFGHVWTVSNIQVFAPGSYSFLGVTATVAPGQLMAHMNWAWNTSTGADLYQLWNTSTGGCFGDCATQLWTGPDNPAGHTFDTHWDWVSVDTLMPNGIVPQSNFNYNLHMSPVNLPAAVPLPPAVWLFCSGLLGLGALIRRKRKTG